VRQVQWSWIGDACPLDIGIADEPLWRVSPHQNRRRDSLGPERLLLIRRGQISDSSADISPAGLRPLLLRTTLLSSSPGRNPTTRIAGTVIVSSVWKLRT
jgi:hypothetical protein